MNSEPIRRNETKDAVDVSFVLPVFNEARQILDRVTVLYDFLSNTLNHSFEVIICDDGSTDDTYRIASHFSSQHAAVIKCLSYEKNRGRGYAVKYAEQYVRGVKLIHMDIDSCKGPYLEELVEDMIERLDSHDIVIASRFLTSSNIKRKPLRNIVSVVYRAIVHIAFPRLHVKDTDVGFKGVRREVFSHLNRITTLNRWSYELQFLVNARELNYTIYELPFHWNERLDDFSTVKIVRDSLEQLYGILYTKFSQIHRKLARERLYHK